MMRCIGFFRDADVAIGYNAAYFTQASHIVDLVLDQGMFGFFGISELMRRLRYAIENESDLTSMVEQANLVV